MRRLPSLFAIKAPAEPDPTTLQACSHSARRLRNLLRRQVLHRRVAEILREHAATEPELLAHHYSQAGMNEAAIEFW
jgi:hypothetical protein